ncbi:hypothetical protein M407DRAFT_17885 [Tulasnella calospora MUT 4182]|uniref:DRBM domain-containing protein n=1 Tax=Tulasnella calospora MUT 4182 TaxID=1051891 RepID=A0A0C3QL29_9AGAM|nr:hypothetical protein M407DRAFT_17885 [Tulasnella calospora MUT 4182]
MLAAPAAFIHFSHIPRFVFTSHYSLTMMSYAPAAVSNSTQFRFQMRLHNLQMLGKVFYMESAVSDGPRHHETWTAYVFLLDAPEGVGKVIGQFIGRAKSRQAAREQASGQALAALGQY